MAGTLKVGGKVLATHNSETDEVSLVVKGGLIIPSHSSNPTSSNLSELYFNTEYNNLKIFTSTGWNDVFNDLSSFSRFNTSSMAHSTINTQEAGSTKITTYGASAWSVIDSSSTSQFGAHDGHDGSPADWPAYIAIDFGAGIKKPINRLDIVIHGNSFGYFELQGSNDAGTGTFYDSGTWTSLTFVTSNNSQNNQNAGGSGSGYSDGTRLTFQYNNNQNYRYYRFWIKDNSTPSQSIGTKLDGWAIYYWELYRV